MGLFYSKYNSLIEALDPRLYSGKVIQVIGLTIEAVIPYVEIGEICRLYNLKGTAYVLAEVVGFKLQSILLMPLGDLKGIGPGSTVTTTKQPLKVPVGPSLLGRVLDSLGNPIDGKGRIATDSWVPLDNNPPTPMGRKRINTRISMGIRSIDSFLTCGVGQRMGIFAGSGVGKSTLLGMIARNTDADINIIGLIGERGREVREFIEKDLGESGLARSVVIVATSDQPALLRMKGAMTATAIAEYFRDQGANTMLMMDSLTRFAMAQREIGLAIGEPPVARGYTPSVYTVLPKLLERSGNSESGSITGLYTVLVDGDDMNEPIADTARGILDGHIVLSRDLADQNHFPAIDVLRSISRIMPDITDIEHMQTAGYLRGLLSVYQQSQDIIQIGAYQKGSNPRVDEAISRMSVINALLRQDVHEKTNFETTMHQLIAIKSD